MTLKLTIPKKRQAIPKTVQRRLHRESKSKRRINVQSESSDDELIHSYINDRKRSHEVFNRKIRLKTQSSNRSSRRSIPSVDDNGSDENISKNLRDAANAAKSGVSSMIQTSIVSPESDESSDDELVSFRKVKRSEYSDDELVAVPKLNQAPFSREESEKGDSTSMCSLKLRESESDIVSDDKYVQKSVGKSPTEEGSLKISAPWKETDEKGEESSSEDEFISISISVSNGASVNGGDPGTTDKDAPLYCDRTEASSSKPSKSAPSDSDSDDEPIAFTSKKKAGNPPSGVSKSKVNSKKCSTKKKMAASKRPKKVYEMPGQKKDKPDELNGARIFYESLREQIPDSQMAEEYLLKYGLLSLEEATVIVEGKSLTSRSAVKRNNTEKSNKRKRSPKIKEILSRDSSSDEEVILTKKAKV